MPKGFQYPIFKCADGYVRICLLAKRQWRGMFGWMGEPAQFASPEFDSISARYKSAELLYEIAAFFADKPRGALEAEGQAHGVPISAVLTLEESIAGDHVRERKALRCLQLADGASISVPNGVISIDGARMAASDAPAAAAFPAPSTQAIARAFDGLKVLDLGRSRGIAGARRAGRADVALGGLAELSVLCGASFLSRGRTSVSERTCDRRAYACALRRVGRAGGLAGAADGRT